MGDQSASQRRDIATNIRWLCQAMMKHRAEGMAGTELCRDGREDKLG